MTFSVYGVSVTVCCSYGVCDTFDVCEGHLPRYFRCLRGLSRCLRGLSTVTFGVWEGCLPSLVYIVGCLCANSGGQVETVSFLVIQVHFYHFLFRNK